MRLHNKIGLVGGAWEPNSSNKLEFLDLDDPSICLRQVPKASLMYEFVVWDALAEQKSALSVLSLPMKHAPTGALATEKGNFNLLWMVGQFLEVFSAVTKAVAFDSYGSHLWVRKLLLGQEHGVDEDMLKEVPFFNKLKFQLLPPHCLLSLPLKVCIASGEPIYCVSGPCAAAHSVATVRCFWHFVGGCRA